MKSIAVWWLGQQKIERGGGGPRPYAQAAVQQSHILPPSLVAKENGKRLPVFFWWIVRPNWVAFFFKSRTRKGGENPILLYYNAYLNFGCLSQSFSISSLPWERSTAVHSPYSLSRRRFSRFSRNLSSAAETTDRHRNARHTQWPGRYLGASWDLQIFCRVVRNNGKEKKRMIHHPLPNMSKKMYT